MPEQKFILHKIASIFKLIDFILITRIIKVTFIIKLKDFRKSLFVFLFSLFSVNLVKEMFKLLSNISIIILVKFIVVNVKAELVRPIAASRV